MTNESGLIPLGRAVLVKPYESEAVTKGGLIIPNQVRESGQLAEQRAVVVAVGPEAWCDEQEPRAKVGDRVLYSKYSGYLAKGTLDGEAYRVVNDRDIFLRIEGEVS